MKIRTAVYEDVDALAALDKICFAVPWSREAFYNDIVINDKAMYLVAECDGRIAGYAGLWLILDEGHITNVAVHPDFRRRGMARAVVGELVRRSEAQGATCQTLEVRAGNAAAISLYESLGFKAAGVRRGYYADNGEDAIIMWRRA